MFRLIAAASTLASAAALAAAPVATAAPTCTDGDLQTRVNYTCRLAPWAPLPESSSQSPSYPHCNWLPSDWQNRYDVTRTCREKTPLHW